MRTGTSRSPIRDIAQFGLPVPNFNLPLVNRRSFPNCRSYWSISKYLVIVAKDPTFNPIFEVIFNKYSVNIINSKMKIY